MFPSVVADNHLKPRYFGGRMIPVQTRKVVNEDNIYHNEKYRQRVRAVLNSVKDDANNQKKYVTGYYRSLVASNGNALGSGNKLFFENTGYKDGRFTGGVLHTPEGIAYAKDLLQRRAQEFEAISQDQERVEPSIEQPVPLTKEQGMKLEVGMFLDEIHSSLTSGTTYEGRIDDFKKVFRILVQVGMDFTMDELNEVREKIESIYNDLTATETGITASKRTSIIEVVDIMYEFVQELIGTFSLPPNERVKRIQDYVQRIGRTMVKDTGKKRPSKQQLKEDVSKTAPEGKPEDPELDQEYTRLKELKKDPKDYVQQRGERVQKEKERAEETERKRQQFRQQFRQGQEADEVRKTELMSDLEQLYKEMKMLKLKVPNKKARENLRLKTVRQLEAHVEKVATQVEKEGLIKDMEFGYAVSSERPPRGLRSASIDNVRKMYGDVKKTLIGELEELHAEAKKKGKRKSPFPVSKFEAKSIEGLAESIVSFKKALGRA